MTEQNLTDRNSAEVFAQRTRRNLEFIENAGRSGEDVHQVVQISLSLLGLVVFPREKEALEPALLKKSIADMNGEGWPRWVITLGKNETKTLGDIVRHLRNAAAHGRLTFDSDSREPSEVTITVEDAEDEYSPPYWRGALRADKLRNFCLRLLDFIEDTIG